MNIRKRLIVVGDRLLIRPEEGEGRTRAGLILPATAATGQEVRGGRVVSVGPGLPVADPTDQETWKKKPAEARYVPLQAQEGDFALFIQSAAVEITFENQKYLIVPNNAVLVLVREELDLDSALGSLGPADDEDERLS